MCDCACRVVQTLQAKPLFVCVYLFMVATWLVKQSIQFIWLVTKHALHTVVLILLIACVTGQCSQFFLCCH